MTGPERMSDPRDELAGSWRDNAQGWTRAVRGGAIESRRIATDGAILDAVLAQSARRVLDLGCGEGWLVRALCERGVKAVGVDGSAPLVEAARAAGGGRFVVADYDALIADPSRCGGPFDAVVANFALLDDDIVALLSALRGVLSPHGALLVQTLHPIAAGPPYEDGWRREDFRGFGTGDWTPMPWYFRTLGSWISALGEAGYVLTALAEPVHPGTGQPLSLLMEARPR